jgi:membrane protein DedA with SNARE-associated domain
MIEDILSHIGELTPFWIYASLFAFAYVENVFPPSPSDLVVVNWRIISRNRNT